MPFAEQACISFSAAIPEPPCRLSRDQVTIMPPEHGIARIPQRAGRRKVRRFAPAVVILLVAVLILAMGWHRQLSLETLVRHRDALDAFVDGHYAAALATFVGVYIAAVSLSIPGAVFLTIAGGLLFGVIVGGAAVVVAATTGATVIFLIARSAFSEYVIRRAGPRLSKIVDGFCADAFSYLLFLRLVPVFPFFLVNLAPALVGVRVTTFVAATAIGVIPATFVFASVGAGLDSVIQAQASMYHACLAAGRTDCRLDFDPAAALTPQLIGALIALGLLALAPVAVRRVFGRRAAMPGKADIAGRECEPREQA
jgi:uncharacterized membrane protein YdjX (TVP38/TMEM64 family)